MADIALEVKPPPDGRIVLYEDGEETARLTVDEAVKMAADCLLFSNLLLAQAKKLNDHDRRVSRLNKCLALDEKRTEPELISLPKPKPRAKKWRWPWQR